MNIRPQPGPQEVFLSSKADIAIFGGAAGCGKTYALLLEPLRHKDNKNFGAVVFRREMPQITTEGGLWDTGLQLYSPLGADFIQNPYRARFKSSAKIEFHHLQMDKTCKSWDGSQIPLILFDELQHFSDYQFFYMLSRNRTSCGIKPYVRATCNPDPKSWLRYFISWWIDQETGYPIQERSGVIRYMIRLKGEIIWGDTEQALIDIYGSDCCPKSVTFVPAKLDDNPIMLSTNPAYRANLKALPRHEQERLLNGNWFVVATAGSLFDRNDFEIVDVLPNIRQSARYWDRASTEQSENNADPDYTAGVKVGQGFDGYWYIMDVARFREKPHKVQTTMRNVASQDGIAVPQVVEHDPGQAGVAEMEQIRTVLAGYNVVDRRPDAKKYIRWKPLAAQVQAGNVRLLKGSWNKDFLDELHNLTDNEKDYDHDDQADGASGAFNYLALGLGGSPMYSPDIN